MSRSADAALQANLAVRALSADERLTKLERYVPPLSVARAFGVGRDEVAHSRVLAELLDPTRHAGALEMVRSLLREIASRIGQGAAIGGFRDTADELGRIADGPLERVAVRRESMLIDVVVEVSGPAGVAVIGLENKVDAGEQLDQIARYQTTLERAYPNRLVRDRLPYADRAQAANRLGRLGGAGGVPGLRMARRLAGVGAG